jgi:hypothetical protein
MVRERVERRRQRLQPLRDEAFVADRHRVHEAHGGGRRHVADPNTGVAVYDSFGSSGGANWFVAGGTSASAPIIAGVYALAGNGKSIAYGSYPYAHRSSLYDETSGHNGSCSPAYLCTARSGYDGPTGLGSPKGTGAF